MKSKRLRNTGTIRDNFEEIESDDGSEGEDDASLPVKKRRIKEELVSEV